MNARHDYWNLWLFLLGKELKAKYKGMVLGYLWSMLLPLCQSLVFLVVFNHFLRFPIKNYFLYLSIGFVMWQFFANSIICGATVLIHNSNLVKKNYLSPFDFYCGIGRGRIGTSSCFHSNFVVIHDSMQSISCLE